MMAMTRKNYRTVADAIARTRNYGTPSWGASWTSNELAAIDAAAREIAEALYETSPRNANGNRTFNVDRFLNAAGVGTEPR